VLRVNSGLKNSYNAKNSTFFFITLYFGTIERSLIDFVGIYSILLLYKSWKLNKLATRVDCAHKGRGIRFYHLFTSDFALSDINPRRAFMSQTEKEISQPPKPPKISRYLSPPWSRIIGVLIILTIPLLALFGVFGIKRTSQQITGDGIKVYMSYATLHRFKTVELIDMDVGNISPNPLPKITIVFDTGYIAGFSKVEFMPHIEQAYEIVLNDVLPHERRKVIVELEAKKYGRCDGTIHIHTEGASPLSMYISIFVYP